MAKWINFHVTGGNNGGAVPEQDGDNLLRADSICAVTTITNGGAGSAMGAVLTLTNAAAGADQCTILVGTGPAGSQSPGNNEPASANYVNKLKAAINRAITANPGGVKSTVSLPQENADANAAYDFSETVYIKSFAIS